MAPEGQACPTSTTRSTGMVSGWIHGPLTLARNTCGVQVTQKREWMQRFASKGSSSFSPGTRSIPSVPLAADVDSPADATGVGATADVAVVAVADADGTGTERSKSRAAR